MPNARKKGQRCVGTYVAPADEVALRKLCKRLKITMADLVRKAAREIIHEAQAQKLQIRSERKRVFVGGGG